MKLSVSRIVRKLEILLAKRKVGLLCGAGISISSGIPDALGITRIMLNKLNCSDSDLRSFLSEEKENSTPVLPVAFESIIGTIVEKIQLGNSRVSFLKVFARNFYANPNHNHHLWGELLRKRKLRFIATTNFDTCFEKFLKIQPLSRKIIFPYDIDKSAVNRSIESKIIKLHGCMSDPETIGTTIDQISKRESVTNIDILTGKIFTRTVHDTLLIIGYSCSDGMDIGPKITELGAQLAEKSKVKVIYWRYKRGSSYFVWEKLKSAKLTPDNIKAKETFSKFGSAIQITGDLDLCISNFLGGPTVGYKKKFDFNNQVSNPLVTLGAVFQNAGFYELAISYLKKALETPHLKRKKYLIELVELYRDLGVAHNYNGSFEKSLFYHRKALRLLKDNRPNAFLEIAELLNLLGEDHRDKGDYDNAIIFYDRSVAIYETKTKDTELIIAKIYNNLSDSYSGKSLYDQSIDYAKRSLEIRLKKLGEFNHLVSNTYNNLGFAYSGKGDFKVALSYHKKALQIRIAVYGSLHDWVAQSHINLGAVYVKREMPRSALIHLKKAAKIYKVRIRGEHPILARLYNNMGNAYLLLEDFPKAAFYYSGAIKLWKNSFGEKYFYSAFAYNGLGKTLRELGNFEKARSTFKKGLKVLRASGQQNHSIYDAIQQNLKSLPSV